MSDYRQKSQQRFSSKFSSQQSSLNIIARNFVSALFDVRKDMTSAKKIDFRHFEQTDDEKSLELTFKHKSTSRQSLKIAKVISLFANFTQEQVINHILRRQNDFAIWNNELLNIIDERHEKYQTQSNNTNIKLNQIMNMFQKKSASPSFQEQFKMFSIDLHRFYSIDFFKSNRFDDNDFLQNVMLRLIKNKEMKNTSIEKGKFREFDIDYFDSRKFESYDDDDYVIVTNKIYYRSVWLFIDATKSIAISKNNRLVRTNLHRCFQDDVQTWYIDEINELQRSDLKKNHELKNWEKCLIKRFKMSESKIMKLLAENKYIIENVRKQRTITSYVQSVIRHAKNADFTTINNQLNWVWNHLAPSFQRDVSKSNFKTIVLKFIEQLKNLKHAWKRYYAMKTFSKKRWNAQSQQNLLSASQDHFFQYQQSNFAYSRENEYTNNQNFDQTSSQPSQRDYQNNNQDYSRNNQWNRQNRNDQNNYSVYSQINNQQNQQRMLETLSQQRQISWTKLAFNLVASSMNQQSIQTHHVNQKNDNQQKIYHDQKEKKFEHQQLEHHSAKIEIFFNDNSKSEMNLNFWICDKCSFAFDNSNELRDHFLNYHNVDSRVNTYNKRLQDEKYAKHAKKHVYNYFSQFFFDYAQVNVFIFDYDLISCLNIDEKVSLCSKSLFSQNKNLYDIVHRTRFITITKIVEQQICDECIEKKILLNFNKFPIKIKTYLIDRLQSNLIIDMNVLNRDDIDFQLNRNMLVIKKMNVSLRYSPMKTQTFYHFVICNIMKSIQKNFNKKWKFNVKKSMNYASKMLRISEQNSRIEISNANINAFDNKTINEIDQSRVQNYKQCENAKFEKFSAMYDDLNKFRNVSFFVVRLAVNFVCVFHICRRCKKFFDFDNLLHEHFIHCNRNIKSRDVVCYLIVFWKRL